MAHDEVCGRLRRVHNAAGRMGSIGGEGPAPVFQVGVSNVRLVALEGAPKSKGVPSVRPCCVVPDVGRIANELCVRKVSDGEVIANAEIANASLGLWKLEVG